MVRLHVAYWKYFAVSKWKTKTGINNRIISKTNPNKVNRLGLLGAGAGGGETVPPVATSIEQLLERQWNEGQSFLLQQGAQGDGERTHTHTQTHLKTHKNKLTHSHMAGYHLKFFKTKVTAKSHYLVRKTVD